MSWQTKAEELKFDRSMSYAEIAEELGKSKETVRSYLRRTDKYKQNIDKANGLDPNAKHSMTMNSDGSRGYERIIALRNAENSTPEELIIAHGLDPKSWKLVSAKNNYWEAQGKEGTTKPLYQSKITVKPYEAGEISLDNLKDWFKGFEKSYKPKLAKPIKRDGEYLLEVNIADLHLGKMGWKPETGENYDYQIAEERFDYVIDNIIAQTKDKDIEQIIFPIGNDFFNSDTPGGTTTHGTQQNNDLRWQKMFKHGSELLVRAIEKLSSIAPVKAFNVGGNHDQQSSYYVTLLLAAHFRHYDNVEIDESAMYRKYIEFGNTLIGFAHGDSERKRITQLMQVEAREAWGRTQYHEMHTGHLHSEQVKEEGGLIWRQVSSITGSDAWHSQSGFVGATKKSQNFLYSKEKGLVQIINSVI